MKSATPIWFPDWEGETIIIVGSGPSAVDVPLDLGIGRARFIAINNSWEICPWADALYACDHQWWEAKNGCPEFRGALRVCVDYRVKNHPEWGIKLLACEKTGDRFILNQPGTVGWGGNSGFNCLNFAAQLHPAKIILVGFDMRKDLGSHWHNPHTGIGLSNPSAFSIDRWRRVTDAVAKQLAGIDITVINCSPISALKNYPKMAFEDAIDYKPGDALPPPPFVPSSARPSIECPVPIEERKLLEPINGYRTMLELGNKRNAAGTYKDYFRHMGFDHVSIDMNGKDGALPLNLEEPLNLGRRFDVVTNFGTSEHVDQQEPCWRNTIEHCEKVVISTTPFPGDWSWHGRWYPKPDFYKALAELNGFNLERFYVSGASPRRMLFARMNKVKDLPFAMPPIATFYKNRAGQKVGRYG